MLKKIVFLFMILVLLEESIMSDAAQLTLGKPDDFYQFPKEKKHIFLTEPNLITFTTPPDSYVWISDIEHVIEKNTGEIFLADGENPFYMAGDMIPKNKFFELFPYHFYYKNEEEKLGKKINYSLMIKNIEHHEIDVDISGIGTTKDWDHYKTWEGALRGDGKKSAKLKPGETLTLWRADRLDGDLPWSAIVLGRASGDIMVYDYCFLGDKDPGPDKAKQIPDLTYEPYLLASFTRGTADWNTAFIDYFPETKNANGMLQLSKIKDEIYSAAIAYSPGGPYNKLCNYNTVEPTFEKDRLSVVDPVSKKAHLFFGGNYPIMYKHSLPFINDGDTTRVVEFYISSNDKYNVDTIAGVWIQGKMLVCRVPIVGKNKHWKVFTLKIAPKEKHILDFTVIPLGSRWGGMVTSLEMKTGQ